MYMDATQTPQLQASKQPTGPQPGGIHTQEDENGAGPGVSGPFLGFWTPGMPGSVGRQEPREAERVLESGASPAQAGVPVEPTMQAQEAQCRVVLVLLLPEGNLYPR